MMIPPKLKNWMYLHIPWYKKYLMGKELEHTKMLTNKIKQELLAAAHMLKRIDKLMAEGGMGRGKRRQFWRDFFRDEHAREDVVSQILQYYEQAKESK